MVPKSPAFVRLVAGKPQFFDNKNIDRGGLMLHATKFRHSGEKSDLKKYRLIIVFLILVFCDAEAQSGAWTRKTDVPTARVGASASVVNDTIYVLGGLGAGLVDVAANEMYDPLTDTWESRAPLPTPRGWPSSAVVNGIIYCIGGGYPTFKNKVEAYDPATNTWTTRADMPTARFGAQAAVVNGVIYNIGGYPNLRTCEAYDPSTNTWIPKTERPESGGLFSVTAYDGIIYTFGGGSIDYWGPFSTVYAYDPQTDTWTKKADMPTARFGFETYLVDGMIYAIGGTNSPNGSLATVEVYNPVSDSWAVKSDMPRSFTFFAGAVVNGKIYVIGGTPDMSAGGFEVWEYDPAFHTDVAAGTVSGTWTSANSPYYINGEITVPDGETLTIEPGVEVVFMGHYKFNVQGRLLAVGTKNDTIRFTAEDKETGWHGIRFMSTPNTNDTSKIAYCSFKYGKANTGSGLDRAGGAMLISGFDKVVVSNCLFDSNMQSGEGMDPPEAGPAILVNDASPIITNSTFSNNTGTQGSAVVCKGSSHGTISNSIFSNNTGSYAPIVVYEPGGPIVSGNTISNNIATYGPGGILIGNGSSPWVENNIIIYNQAPGAGGIGCSTSGKAILINNTIAYNVASTNGGGIWCELDSDPILINNIVYGNSAAAGKQVYLADAYSDPIVAYCDVEGGRDGFGGPGAGANYSGLYENNIDVNPLFKNTALDDYRLSSYSLCIGAGIDSVEISGVWYYAPSIDFGGWPRPYPADSKPDIGAREHPRGIPFTDVEREVGNPTVYALYQNYPNPFNPSTCIQYAVGNRQFVSLKIYDILGNEVATLVQEEKPAGRYEVTWNAGNLSSGVYFYRLQASDPSTNSGPRAQSRGFVQTRRLLLLR